MNIRHWNSACNDWSRSLRFYKEEAVILRHRLNDIASRNVAMEVPAQVAHYETEFNRQSDTIDKLLNHISEVVAAVAKEAENYAAYINTKLPKQLNLLEDQYSKVEKHWLDLRNAFYRFCSDWM
ncbi:hypothetical protein SAMN05421788_107222 [Filimonas lacunae]|uniref:Uncharacterized protein n=1 Tax=Filimonas lacunae TaxID=477680 RepID=A0A173MGL3_9BACT|nr:hypothetical protein [Filimonas lacunae]BAV06558.1 hypothetical protein FLA_2577 [Filimonas lacunae]SIT27387.1 hypothetical protein SAMN05421788_107222 [Filimonas lacunae]